MAEPVFSRRRSGCNKKGKAGSTYLLMTDTGARVSRFPRTMDGLWGLRDQDQVPVPHQSSISERRSHDAADTYRLPVGKRGTCTWVTVKHKGTCTQAEAKPQVTSRRGDAIRLQGQADTQIKDEASWQDHVISMMTDWKCISLSKCWRWKCPPPRKRNWNVSTVYS